MATLFGNDIKGRGVRGAQLYEIEIGGATYSAVMLPHQYMWRVVATKMVGGKLMKIACDVDPRDVDQELHRHERTEDAQSMVALRLGWERLKDEVRYNEDKALGKDMLDRFSDPAIDAHILAQAEKAQREHEAEIMAKAEADAKIKRKEEEAMIENAGDMWGAF